ncbi:EamA family transporter [Haloarchaeobius sp. HME9146]|uniref:DMT family transporter n=1 Tax=unclassified Haloarchaeobius TaxID=2614452 RepID=UPI0021C233A7|nr:EamA family transporter [Haloarchaeobius sp. HME9146]
MTRYRNVSLFLVLAAVWGSAFMAIKAGVADIPPVLFAALRYDIAGVLMLGYAVYAVDDWLPRSRAGWLEVVIGGVFMIAAYHALLFVGETGPVSSGAAAVLVALSPVLTTAFARLLLPDEPVTPETWLGMFLALVGVAVLVHPDPDALLSDAVVSKLLVFGAAAAFALGSVLTRRIDSDISIEAMEAWSMLLGALLMHAVSIAMPSESFALIQWTPRAIASLVYLSIFASALGFLIYFDLLDRLGPVEINMVSYVAPVFAALSGWAVLGDTVDVYTVVGFVIIFAGFAVVKRRALAAEVEDIRTTGRQES